MKQTNYYLFDFMDFDSSLQKDEVVLIFGDYTKMLHLIGHVMGFKVMEHK